MKLGKSKQDLLGNLKRYQTELEAKRAESTKLKQKYQVGWRILQSNKPEETIQGLSFQPLQSAEHQHQTSYLQT